MTRKRSSYRPRLVNIPVTKGLHDQIAMSMHLAYTVLERGPDDAALDQLRDIFNMIGLVIEGDARFVKEFEVLNAASDEIVGNVLAALLTAINAIDAMLPRLDVTKMYQAIARLRAMK